MSRKKKRPGSRVLQGARDALAFAHGNADVSAYRIHAPSRRLTIRQQDELASLGALPDEQIDTNDIPEVRDWSGAKRGLFHRSSTRSKTSS
jgi:hypothetical protein